MNTSFRSLALALVVVAAPASAQETAPVPAEKEAQTAPAEGGDQAQPAADPAPAPAAEPAPAPAAEPAPAPAAEPEPEPEPAATVSPDELARLQRAAELSTEATELFQKELYNAAVEKFLMAYETDPQLVFVYNIAVCYERLGDSDNCVDYYEKYLEQFGTENDGDSPEDVVDVRNSIAKCRLGAKVTVTVESDPPGASVSIDQKDTILGQTPYTMRQDPGTYVIYVELPGRQPVRQQIEVRTGKALQLHFKLEKIERFGQITVRANIRGATIFIDGRNIGLTPYEDPIRVDEGPHQITISKDEYTTFSEEITLVAGDEQRLTAELWLREPPTTWKGYLGWTSMGLGAALVVGGFFAGQQAALHYDVTTHKPTGIDGIALPSLQFGGTTEFTTFKMLEQVGYWGGGVLAGLGLTLVILEATDVHMIKDKDELDSAMSDDIRMIPIVTALPGGAYAGAHFTF